MNGATHRKKQMNQDQIDSLVRTVCKMAGGILAAHGLANAATVVNSTNVVEAITGVVVAVIGIAASHTTNATTVSTSTVAPAQEVATTITPKV